MPPMQAPSNVIIPAPPFHSHLATWQPWPMQTSIPILNQAQPSHNARVHSYSQVQSQSPMRQESPMRKRGVASPRAVSRANIAPNADPRSVLKAGTSQILSPLDARAKAPPEPKAVHSGVAPFCSKAFLGVPCSALLTRKVENLTGDLWSNAWHEENSNPCKADRPKWKTTLGHFATNSADPWQGQWFAMNSSPHNAHRPKWDDTLVQ